MRQVRPACAALDCWLARASPPTPTSSASLPSNRRWPRCPWLGLRRLEAHEVGEVGEEARAGPSADLHIAAGSGTLARPSQDRDLSEGLGIVERLSTRNRPDPSWLRDLRRQQLEAASLPLRSKRNHHAPIRRVCQEGPLETTEFLVAVTTHAANAFARNPEMTTLAKKPPPTTPVGET
jgi:hypothetical protein